MKNLPHCMCTIIVASLFNIGASLNVAIMPVEHPDATAVVVAVDDDSLPDFLLVDGQTLNIYLTNSKSNPFRLSLPANASAFDVVPYGNADHKVLVVVAGKQILRYNLPPAMDQHTPTLICELENRLERSGPPPFPHVLSVPFNGRNVLAIPRDDALELRTLKGERIASYPIGPPDFSGVNAPSAYTAWNSNLSIPGDDPSISIQINSLLDATPDAPESLLNQPVPAESPYYPGGVLRATEALNESPLVWPWFPLNADGSDGTRVLYAVAPPADTLIRMRKPEHRDGAMGAEPYATPKRRYPGIPLFGKEGPADFNGDGYTDLLLWKSPLPGTSIGSLTRTIEGGVWPIQLTVHLYSPELGLYEAVPHGKIDGRLPISWFMMRENGVPVRNLVLSDLDNDGRDDIAFTPDDRSFAVWLYKNGFEKDPDYFASLDTRITRIESVQVTRESGERSVLARGEGCFYLLSLR